MKINLGNGQTSTMRESNMNDQSNFSQNKKSFGNLSKNSLTNFSRPVMPYGGAGFRKNDGESSLQKKTINFIDGAVRMMIYLIAFFLPLFFLSNLPSALELAKQVFLVGAVGLAFLVWVGKMAWKNEIRLRKTFLLVSLATFLFISGLSAIFSQYSNQSFWGYFGGESEAYISALFFSAFFILVFNNIRKKEQAQKVLYCFLASGILVFLFSLLHLWGKYVLPGELAKNDFFNTVGSVYSLSVFLAVIFLLALGLFMNSLVKWKTILFAFLSVIFFIGITIFNLKIVWWGLLLALAFVLGVSIVNIKQRNSQKRVLAMVFLVLSLVMLNIRNSFLSKDFPVEVFLKQKIGAKIMLSAWKENPMLGFGQGNFVAIYQSNRPDNLGDFWSVNFNNGSSLFTTLASNLGILGTSAFLFLLLSAIWFVAKGVISSLNVNEEKENDGNFLLPGLSAVWLFLTFIIFFYFFNMTLWFAWWLVLALIFSLIFASKKEIENLEYVTNSKSPGSSLALSFVFVLIIIGFITAIFNQGQKYLAAVYFNQALAADARGENIEEVAVKIQKALELDPKRDVYYRNLSVASFALANKRIADKGQEDLSTEDIAYIKGMISQAKNFAEEAIKLNPSADNYISLAQVYEGVLASMEGADKEVIKNYQEALKHDPRNPALNVKLATVYITLANLEASKEASKQQDSKNPQLPEKSKEYLVFAKEELNKARAIKNDYVDANLLLASVYELEGNLDGAIEKEKENKNLFPGAPEIFFRLGLLYYKKENWNEARDEFKGAISINKDYSNARYFLGLIYDKQKERQLAIEQFEKIAEINPNNEMVKKILDNLKNGKEALAGLDNQQVQQETVQKEEQKISEEQKEEQKDRQNINPQVEPQNIPREAVPDSDEEPTVDQPQPSVTPEK